VGLSGQSEGLQPVDLNWHMVIWLSFPSFEIRTLINQTDHQTRLGGNFPASPLYSERVHELVNARGGQAFAILNGADDVQEKRRAERRSEARDISAENRKLVAQAAQVLDTNGFVIDPLSCVHCHQAVARASSPASGAARTNNESSATTMSEPSRHGLVIVTPVYEEAEACSRLFHELRAALGDSIHIIAVDDGSVAQPLAAASISEAALFGVVIRLKRNVGHQRAIAVGINYVAEHLPGRSVVVMDSDGEDIPKTVKALTEPLESNDVDIAVAQRRSRIETWRFRAFYLAYKWIFRMLTGRRIGFGNFMALKPLAVKRLASMQELWIHIPACVLTSKLRIATCPLDRGPRYVGQSKMNFVALALHGFKGLMVFAEDVLVRVGIACAIVAALSVVGAIAAVVLKLVGHATPGWFSVALGVLVLVFLQTGALTLMTLMLTGVVRGGLVTNISYTEFVESYADARPSSVREHR
jgi:polyisoprenyl-phosphate glycosyltransferase